MNHHCNSRLLRDASATDNDPGGPQFTEVFVIYWVGAGVVTLNIKLLGGSMLVYFLLFLLPL